MKRLSVIFALIAVTAVFADVASFSFKLDEGNNIVRVEYGEIASDTWQVKALAEYSPIWDEAKRCPTNASGSYRYKFENEQIATNAGYLNIDYASDVLMIATDTGVLLWK